MTDATAPASPAVATDDRALCFEVKTQRTYFKILHFRVPEGASVEETAAAIQAELEETSYTFFGHPEVGGATLIADYEVMSDEPEHEVIAVVRLDPKAYPLDRAAD